jgi:hypothetical protein
MKGVVSMRAHRGTYRAFVFTALLVTGLAARADTKDAKAEQIARDMMQAMGGEDAWQKAHFVRFDFRVIDGNKVQAERSHLWDKQTGQYRLEDKTKEGQRRVVLFNLATQQGTVYVDGKKVEGDAATKGLKGAYGSFINDSYWLSMPWKWLDMGVNLKYLGPKQRGSDTADLVELTFGKVGLTPGDRYHAFVSRKTHLMEHWEYKLQSGQTGSWDWIYTTTEGVKLPKDHQSADGKSINMGDVRILKSAPDRWFTDPGGKLEELNGR